MDTTFVNLENSRTSYPYRLSFYLNNKIDERRWKMLNYEMFAFTVHEKMYKVYKAHIKIINLKYQLQHGLINFNYQMDHILYQIFKIILNISLRTMKHWLIIHQYKYVLLKLKMRLYLKLRLDIIFNYEHLILYTIVPNKSFDQLLEISPSNFIFSKSFNSEFPSIEAWFKHQWNGMKYQKIINLIC